MTKHPDKCSECGSTKSKQFWDYDDGTVLCDECEKQHESEKTKSLTQKEFEKLNKDEQKNYVKEWRCTCNECGEKWNFLDSVYAKMKSQMSTNTAVQVTNCMNPCVGTATGNANTQLDKQLKELKQCPKCKSSNVKCEPRYFKKQE